MTVINKQKFLAELGKLLTFMFEEDRLAALEMYSAMYDEAESEEALSQFFMSPTRQAVVIARAYDAGTRKLQGTSKAKDGSTDEAKYVSAIENLRAEAVSRGIIVEHFAELEAEEIPVEEEAPAEDENQISLFETAEEPVKEAAESSAEEAPAEVEAPAAEENAPAATKEEAPVPAPEAPEIIRNEDQINAFIEQFHIEAENIAEGENAAADKENVPAETAEEAPAAEEAAAPAIEAADVEELPTAEEQPTPEEQPALEETEVHTVRKPKVFLLLLYIIAAIPVTVVGFALLLVPTLLLLALAATFVAGGVGAMMSVFSGFAVLADILVVLGLALAICAVALFLVWTFIWFTVDVLIGFVVGIFKLGGKWCYKEVPAV